MASFFCSLRSECSITLLSPFRAAFHSRSRTFPFSPSRQLLSSNRDRFSTLIVGSRAKEGLSSARKRNTRPVYFAKNNNHFSALLVARGARAILFIRFENRSTLVQNYIRRNSMTFNSFNLKNNFRGYDRSSKQGKRRFERTFAKSKRN